MYKWRIIDNGADTAFIINDTDLPQVTINTNIPDWYKIIRAICDHLNGVRRIDAEPVAEPNPTINHAALVEVEEIGKRLIGSPLTDDGTITPAQVFSVIIDRIRANGGMP